MIIHIIGMTSNIKEDFMTYIRNEFPYIVIIDIDELYKSNYCSKKHKSHVNKQISQIIKTTNLNTPIMLLDTSMYYRTHYIHIKIEPSFIILLKMDHKLNAKHIIAYNLEHYQNEIIDGIFPLKYLSIPYLSNKYKQLLTKYSDNKMNISYKELKKWINEKFKRQNSSVAYFCINHKFDETINLSQNNNLFISAFYDRTIAYNDKWMALISCIPNNRTLFNKGFMTYDNIEFPYIEEKMEDAFDDLKSQCYIYELDINLLEKETNRKYKIPDIIKYFKRTFIPDIYTELLQNKVKFIRFNQQQND